MPSAVDVFLLRPEALALDDRDALLSWLHPSELERYHRFVFDRHRLEFLATRALVRRALSSVRPIDPPAWQFRITTHGRPEIDPPCGIAFNLANHPTLTVCALRTAASATDADATAAAATAADADADADAADPRRVPELGVDVEPLTRGAEIVPLAPSVFSVAERAALHALPAAAQPDRALSLWTLKEAYIKARSLGLSLPLDGFSFSFDSDPPRISFAASIADIPERWTFRTLDLLDHRISLALEATDPPPLVRVHHVTRLGPSVFDVDHLVDRA